MTPKEFRKRVRNREFRGQTAGRCPGYVQANLAIIPAADAEDFRKFCELNPKPCPILAVGEKGSWSLPTLGEDIDVRRDAPSYVSFTDGMHTGTHPSLEYLWQDDFVVFALGCSLSFEHLLLKEEIPVRHIELGGIVPAYVSGIPNRAVGRFAGNLVVSMRPFTPKDAIRAIEITSRHPEVHGAPVHFGDPEAIGIVDIRKPEYLGPVEIQPGEVPVFWACGITPQRAMMAAKLPLAIAHEAGHMLVTDIPLAS